MSSDVGQGARGEHFLPRLSPIHRIEDRTYLRQGASLSSLISKRSYLIFRQSHLQRPQNLQHDASIDHDVSENKVAARTSS